MLYHKTKDILYVKQQMGHKKIETTLVYTQLIDFKDDEYVSATAKSLKEACDLIEAGFDYVTEMGDVKIFRKRKWGFKESIYKLLINLGEDEPIFNRHDVALLDEFIASDFVDYTLSVCNQ